MPEISLKGFLLDLDGTLADTAPDLAAALNAVLLEEDRAPLPFSDLRPFVSYGAPRLIQIGFGRDLDSVEFERLRARLLDNYRADICRETRLFPGIGEVLDAIESAGLAWGIVTNKPGWLTEPLLDELGLLERARSVISGDTLSNRKPHPDPLLRAAADLAVHAAQCVYIGDAQRDIEAGRAAGMVTIAASWGYIPDDEDVDDWDAHHIADAPREILDYVAMRERAI